MPDDHVLPLAAAKAAVIEAYKRSTLTHDALALRMGINRYEITRILDPNHNTKINRLHAFAQALGGRLDVSFTMESEDDTRV